MADVVKYLDARNFCATCLKVLQIFGLTGLKLLEAVRSPAPALKFVGAPQLDTVGVSWLVCVCVCVFVSV